MIVLLSTLHDTRGVVSAEEQLEAMKLYAALLDEARGRIGAIEDILNGWVHLLSPILHESCFLQMRFLCELIAAGSPCPSR